ncbi:MAG: SDR family NAD(P)-dependent oxidoreductase [Thermoplasmata archaeon]|nr:SDR family NAD(P)-dependent oxidoreductase [Thermoplasmata archaeon]
MRVLVTGGAGFIGSNLVERFLAEGEEVVVLDNLSTGRLEFLEPFTDAEGFEFVRGDLLRPEDVARAVSGVDMVYHLAANADVRGGSTNTRLDLEQGVVATHNLLEAMREEGVGRLAFSSSSVVYGEASVMPTPEDYGPLVPISLYGASKLAAEGFITAYAHTFDIQAWIFRFANIIGKHGTHGVIYDFINKLRENPKVLEILGDGRQSKSYLLVEDCVDAMLFAVDRSRERVNIFNLGNRGSTTVAEIGDIVKEAMGLPGARSVYTGTERGWAGDVRQMELSIERITGLGWRPSCDSTGAVRRAARTLVEEVLGPGAAGMTGGGGDET